MAMNGRHRNLGDPYGFLTVNRKTADDPKRIGSGINHAGDGLVHSRGVAG